MKPEEKLLAIEKELRKRIRDYEYEIKAAGWFGGYEESVCQSECKKMLKFIKGLK